MENFYLPLYADLDIYIAIYSLRYEDNSVSIKTVSRTEYQRMKDDKKTGREWNNDYFERVTHTKANKILEDNTRQQILGEYDKAIMSKYNVGSNYKENRWFMEQVRPTIF
jgi:hypothetical protein